MSNVTFIEKDQVWVSETTNYWFDVDDEQWAISDCNGELTLLDCDGCPVASEDCGKKYAQLFQDLAPEYKKHICD